MIRAGLMKHYVAIEEPTESQNSIGETTFAWSVYRYRYGAFRTKSGREVYRAQQVDAEVDGVWELHYTGGITPKMRVVWGSRIFAIRQVENVDEGGFMTRLYVREQI